MYFDWMANGHDRHFAAAQIGEPHNGCRCEPEPIMTSVSKPTEGGGDKTSATRRHSLAGREKVLPGMTTAMERGRGKPGLCGNNG